MRQSEIPKAPSELYRNIYLSFSYHPRRQFLSAKMSNSKPSFLVITGSFTRPSFYDPVVNAVEAKGYEIRALHSPSVGLETGPREGEPPTMFDDAAFIAKETEKLADESKNVILIAHSYGGVPATESTKGLGRGERQAQGKKGGIIRLAYMTAMVPAVGKSGALVDVPEENLVPLKMDVGTSSLSSFNPTNTAVGKRLAVSRFD